MNTRRRTEKNFGFESSRAYRLVESVVDPIRRLHGALPATTAAHHTHVLNFIYGRTLTEDGTYHLPVQAYSRRKNKDDTSRAVIDRWWRGALARKAREIRQAGRLTEIRSGT